MGLGKNSTTKGQKEVIGPDGTRTRNPLVRSQVPYPLGHKTLRIKPAILNLFKRIFMVENPNINSKSTAVI